MKTLVSVNLQELHFSKWMQVDCTYHGAGYPLALLTVIGANTKTYVKHPVTIDSAGMCLAVKGYFIFSLGPEVFQNNIYSYFTSFLAVLCLKTSTDMVSATGFVLKAFTVEQVYQESLKMKGLQFLEGPLE